MKSLILALFILTVSTAHAVASCEQFSGTYSIGPSGCFTIHNGKTYPDNAYYGMDIHVGNSDNSLEMHYLTGGSNGFTVAYIADGKEHDGDIYNSGKTYIASCDSNQIKSTRNGMFIAPFEMTFVKNQDGSFTLTETITASNPFTRACPMVRTP